MIEFLMVLVVSKRLGFLMVFIIYIYIYRRKKKKKRSWLRCKKLLVVKRM